MEVLDNVVIVNQIIPQSRQYSSMLANVLRSFAVENLRQVSSVSALAQSPQYGLEFHDRSELDPVKDRVGRPLPDQPEDTRADPVRKELQRLLQKPIKLVIAIGDATHRSNWVNWEIQTFYD